MGIEVNRAIVVTIEYAFNHLTRRLIGLRSEFSGDAFWVERLGKRVARRAGPVA